MAVFYLYTRFITNNLLVEVTSTKTAARLFAWALKRQMFISFFLYCAGKGLGFRTEGVCGGGGAPSSSTAQARGADGLASSLLLITPPRITLQASLRLCWV